MIHLTHRIETDAGGRARWREPLRVGIPLPRGALKSTDQLALYDRNRERLPVQVAVLDRWRDGSARWILVDCQATAMQPESTLVMEIADAGDPASLLREHVTVSEQADSVVVDTGAARFVLSPGGSGWFAAVERNGQPLIDASRSGLHVVDAGGHPLRVEITGIQCDERGPLRVAVSAVGIVRADGHRRELLRCHIRLHFFAGLPTVRHELTILNPRRARHSGGFWELGDAGSVRVREISVAFALAPVHSLVGITGSPELAEPAVTCASRFGLYQDSSGCPNWQNRNHLTADGDISVQFRGYRMHVDESERNGLHATPSVSLRHTGGTLSLAMQYFWQNFPKSLDADRTGIRLGLFPSGTRYPHEIQGGEQKTHSFTVAFDEDIVSKPPLEWCRRPAEIAVTPEWYCSTQSTKYLVPAAEDSNHGYTALTDAAVDGDHAFVRKREVIDEFGWRNFGDLYADHEAALQAPGDPPLVSHYNNQYDAVAGLAYHFMRTGDRRWWTLMDELASHVVDIDVYHTADDKAAYNHGLFWHTDHYQDAGTSTHRSFPRRATVRGGGPSPDHNYTTGLMLHYFLTGEARSRDAVIELAQWVIDMDDGRLTPFRWFDSGLTGLISISGTIAEHGPARAPGNSLSALIDGHRLTGNSVFLKKADDLIRRCIHPVDDVAARNLHDAERRWSYTLFLQALGKYLDWKIDLGELDEMYAYARASLLTYARWMAEHERPFLDRPEGLQYPTETWAAQDMRKSEIFKLAAMHAVGEERARFLERGRFFFDYVVRTMHQSPNRSSTRPLVLLLCNWLMQAYFDRNPDIVAPAPSQPFSDFGAPQVFVPQKIRAKKRALLVAGLGIAALTGAVAALATLWR